MMRKRPLILLLALVISSVGAAMGIFLSIQGASSATPIASPRISALDDAAPPAVLNPDDITALSRLSVEVVGNQQAAEERARKLRVGLGDTSSDFLALRDSNNGVCMVLTKQFSACDAEVVPGIVGAIGGGYDSFRGAFAAIANDDVVAVDLIIDGVNVAPAVDHNVIFAELPNNAHHAVITAHYANGSIATRSVQLAP